LIIEALEMTKKRYSEKPGLKGNAKIILTKNEDEAY